MLIVVVISLVSILTLTAYFILDGDQSDAVDANVKLEETENGAVATILNSQNVEEFKIKTPSNNTYTISGVGSEVRMNDGSGRYIVIAYLDDGTKKVFTISEIQAKNDQVQELEGIFKVRQDTDKKDSYGILERPFNSTNEYGVTINPNTENNNRTLTSTEPTVSEQKLLSNIPPDYIIDPSPTNFTKRPGDLFNLTDNNILPNIESISTNPSGVGIHSIGSEFLIDTKLCKGDEILLSLAYLEASPSFEFSSSWFDEFSTYEGAKDFYNVNDSEAESLYFINPQYWDSQNNSVHNLPTECEVSS